MIPCLDRSTLGFDVPLPHYLRAAAGAGFRAAEFSIAATRRFLGGRSPGVVRVLAEQLGIELAQFTCGTGVPSNIAVGPDAFRGSVRRWQESCSLAESLGCFRGALLVDPAVGDGFCRWGQALSTAEIEERLELLCRIAEEHGIRVSVEFIQKELLMGAGEVLRNVAAGNLGVLVDTYVLHGQGVTGDALQSLPAGSVSWVHIADGRRAGALGEHMRPGRLLPGEGEIDLVQMLEACQARAYDGHVSLEVPQGRVLELPLRERAEGAARSLLSGSLALFFQGRDASLVKTGGGALP